MLGFSAISEIALASLRSAVASGPPVTPPDTPPGTGAIQDIYSGLHGSKVQFWRQVTAEGIRRGPFNIAGRIRR